MIPCAEARTVEQVQADMAVTCNYHVSLCTVSMFAAASAPHYTHGIGVLDTSTYCSAETINHSYGWSLNVTTTIGSCLSNNTFWVESEPEIRVWT